MDVEGYEFHSLAGMERTLRDNACYLQVELYSERMKADGFDPLPTYIPPREDPRSRPDLASAFPLQLLSPPRPQFLNSTFANQARHRLAAGDPTVELAESDASARGLVDGQWAEVFNARGRFQARVALTGAVKPGVAVATGTYWNKLSPGRSNVNSTTSSALTDMGGGATFFDNLVEVCALVPASNVDTGLARGPDTP